MIRYYKQKDTYSCGPIVLYNAKKWMGIKGNWGKEKRELQEICRCRKSHGGTSPINLHKAMEAVFPKMSGDQHENPKLSWIDKQLKLGRAIIIRFFHDMDNKRVGHYILITKQTPKMYQVVGWRRKYTTEKVRRHEIATSLRLKKGSHTPIAWAVSKRISEKNII